MEARRALGIQGMVVLGKGREGKKLLDETRIRYLRKLRRVNQLGGIGFERNVRTILPPRFAHDVFKHQRLPGNKPPSSSRSRSRRRKRRR